MPSIPTGWFNHHVYLAVFLATVVEGLGLPLPAEVLFIATAGLVRRGTVGFGWVVCAAAGGNVTGSLLGFSIAYVGGQRLIESIFRLMGVKAGAVERVGAFFRKYGATTVFLSRFVGVIRAATIYSAGLARMQPWKFALYVFAAAVIWNGGWATLAYQFGSHLPGLMHRALGRSAVWLVALIGAFIVGRFLLVWYRRRTATGS